MPSVSSPCPVKVTDCPTVAGLGVMESMVAVGGVLEEEDWRIRNPQFCIIGFIVLGEVNMVVPLCLPLWHRRP